MQVRSWWRELVAGRPGGEGESHTRPRPATVVPRKRIPLGEGHPGTLAGRGPTGEDEPRACAHLPGSAVGSGEESGETFSARGRDLKAFLVVDCSTTRLAYLTCRCPPVMARPTSEASRLDRTGKKAP